MEFGRIFGDQPTGCAEAEHGLSSQVSPARVIRVHGDQERVGPGLLPVLESIFPARFTFGNESNLPAAGEILIAGNEQIQPIDRSISSLTVSPSAEKNTDGKSVQISVQYGTGANVPFPFRGRSLQTTVASAPAPLSLRNNEIVLASCESGPVWVMSDSSGAPHFRSAFALPRLSPEGSLHDVLNGDRFLEMIPLLHWLRATCSQALPAEPRIKACFIFDDPNLHWSSYGFINFLEIAKHAESRNYHVCFATIPLDGWGTHKSTAQLFRNRAKWMSLAIHGNDHTREELARDYSPAERRALLHQAIRRIKRLETASGLTVSRVMIPPHGACSEAVLADLPGCGFEAACVSHGSLRVYNQRQSWSRNLGYRPCELVQGCPVLPRWSMANRPINTILLAAFCGQAIILRGHHADLADGIEMLDDLANLINTLGVVQWSDLSTLSRTMYDSALTGKTFRIRPLTRKVQVQLPVGASDLIIESESGLNSTGWEMTGIAQDPVHLRAWQTTAVEGVAGHSVTLESMVSTLPPEDRGRRGTGGAAFVRRCLTETRDRLLPALSRGGRPRELAGKFPASQ